MQAIITRQTVTNTHGQTFELGIEDRGEGKRPYRVGAIHPATGQIDGPEYKTIAKAQEALNSRIKNTTIPLLDNPISTEYVTG